MKGCWFCSNSESVRDVQFLPKSTSAFTSVSENGSVQLWDIRKGGERPFLTFAAHSGPVFSKCREATLEMTQSVIAD
jgi:WD40 repeat protein